MTQLSKAWSEMIDSEFRELADNAPVMIWRSRPDKLCDWFNKPWQNFSGKTQEQLFGYGWAEDVHPEDFDRCVKTYIEAFDARNAFTMPYRLKRADGEYRWFLDNGAPFFRNGAFAGYFGSCIDITEQREAEEHQRVLLDELNHRVKNNLQLILSFLQLSKIRASTDEAKELLTNAMSRIRGVGVIQDELYKSVDGGVELGSYLTTLAKNVVNIESERFLRLATVTEPIRVKFEDASNFGLIVNELVTNAIKHGGQQMTEVRLELLRVDEQNISLSVQDNGGGFHNLAALDNKIHNSRGTNLIDALARRLQGKLSRSNCDGATILLTCPLPNLPSTHVC